MITILLGSILSLNIIWFIVWFYRKTQTLSYKTTRFIQKEKVKCPHSSKGLPIHEEALLQLFMRCGNEDKREELRSEYKRAIVLAVFDKHLNKVKDEDCKYLINPKAKFILREAPKAPPIDDEDLIEL